MFRNVLYNYRGLSLQVSLAFIGISFIGWSVFTAGFGLYRKWYEQYPNNEIALESIQREELRAQTQKEKNEKRGGAFKGLQNR